MGLQLPRVVLDPCGGAGQLARIVAALTGVDVRLTDIAPQREAAWLYAAFASIDATISPDLTGVVRLTGARAILSNFPFKKPVYAAIFTNCLDVLRRGDIELFVVMQRAQRALDSAIGVAETAHEPLYFGTIACAWRSWLWAKKPGEASPKGSYAWHVYTTKPRASHLYSVCTIDRAEAQAALDRIEGKKR